MIGRRISHYDILEKLGSGGMGSVYKAFDTKLGRTVALKFLPPDLSPSAQQISLFEQEAKILSALNHPNIETIHDLDEVDGQKFLVLEYLPGGTLESRLGSIEKEHRSLSVDTLLEYGIQIAEGLAYAHRSGIIHRDLKTDNMMFTEQGTVKLTDFGLALLRTHDDEQDRDDISGTVSYMSPEQVRGEDIDTRSDIFSLGVVLYRMATSRLPFSGQFKAARIYSILNEDPPSVSSFRKDIPSGVERIIQRCLVKSKEHRYKSADDLVRDLTQARLDTQRLLTPLRRLARSRWFYLFVILAIVVAFYFFSPWSETPGSNHRTVAVLPFSNMSGNPEDDYFCSGVTEDIRTQLSAIANLNVISRTTMMQYKGSKKTIREIGEELDAGVILEGSIRRQGNRVRISGQLIDAFTDRTLWANSYDGDMSHVFDVQSDVAKQIAEALEARLLPDERARIERKPTSNPEAYNYYLKGREYYYEYNREKNEIAIDLFKKAIAADADYAAAWARLGDAYVQRYARFGASFSWIDSAMKVSETAIRLDSSSAEGYKTIGMIYYYKGRIDSSLALMQRAVQLNPNYFEAVANIGIAYEDRGELDQAIRWLMRGIKLSPTFVGPIATVGNIYRVLGDFEKSEQWLTKAIELQPGYLNAQYFLATAKLLQGKEEPARQVVTKLIRTNPGNLRVVDNAGLVALYTGDFDGAKKLFLQSRRTNPSFESDLTTPARIGLGYLLLREGERIEGRALLQLEESIQMHQINRENATPLTYYRLTQLSAVLGDRVRACEYFEKALEAGWHDYLLTRRDPTLEAIRDEAGYRSGMNALFQKLARMRREVEKIDDK